MSYHVYHTEAIILGGRPHGEGDRMLYCYTRELGLVVAHAKSLRESRSRLRYTLQTFAHAELDLIQGKHGWKIISARPVDSLGALWQHPEKRRVLSEVGALVRRLIQGEESHAMLFDEILSGINFLREVEEQTLLRSGELILVIRLLSRLGYWEEKETHPLLFEENLSHSSLAYAALMRPKLLVSVNNALHASQL